MPNVNDIVSIDFIQEYDGVQMSNRTYWEVDSLGNEPTVPQALDDIVGQFHVAFQDRCSDQWAIVCAIYRNITSVETKAVLFTTLAGADITQGHPQDQVLRFNEYARREDNGNIARGAFNLSGTTEQQSVRGRTSSIFPYDVQKSFLSSVLVTAGPGWQLQPMLRIVQVQGNPPVYRYDPILFVQESTRFFKLGKRKTNLCAVR